MGKTLLRGFIGIAPIAFTITLIIWLYEKLEIIFGTPIQYLLGPQYYFKGLGLIIALVVLYLVGLILNHWVIQTLYNLFERVLKRIPLLKTIYTSITDLMSFFHSGEDQEDGKVVVVDVNGMRVIGLVTRETFDDLPEGVGSEADIAVFIPFSYQIGGFTVLIERSKVQPVDFTIERGLRFAVTAGSPSADKPTYTPKKSFRKAKDPPE